MMLRWPACLTAFFIISLVLPAQGAEEPEFLSFSGGVFDLGKDQKAAEGRLEYRSNFKLWILLVTMFSLPFSVFLPSLTFLIVT